MYQLAKRIPTAKINWNNNESNKLKKTYTLKKVAKKCGAINTHEISAWE